MFIVFIRSVYLHCNYSCKLGFTRSASDGAEDYTANTHAVGQIQISLGSNPT